jgi:chromate transporter
MGTLPFWEKLRQSRNSLCHAGNQCGRGRPSFVAFYHPIWTSAIFTPKDFSLAAAAFLLLTFWSFRLGSLFYSVRYWAGGLRLASGP